MAFPAFGLNTEIYSRMTQEALKSSCWFTNDEASKNKEAEWKSIPYKKNIPYFSIKKVWLHRYLQLLLLTLYHESSCMISLITQLHLFLI